MDEKQKIEEKLLKIETLLSEIRELISETENQQKIVETKEKRNKQWNCFFYVPVNQEAAEGGKFILKSELGDNNVSTDSRISKKDAKRSINCFVKDHLEAMRIYEKYKFAFSEPPTMKR